jgi:hypothetical protein
MTKEERRYDLVKQFMGPIIYSGLSPKDAAAKGLAYADAVLSALESEPKAEIVSQVKEPFYSVGELTDTYVWYLAESESDCIYELPPTIFNALTEGTLEGNQRRYSTRDRAMTDFDSVTRATKNLGES